MRRAKTVVGALLEWVLTYYEAVICAMGVCMFITYATYHATVTEVIWGQGLKTRIIGMVSNGLGIAGWTGVSWFVDAWKALPLLTLVYIGIGFIGILLKAPEHNQRIKIVGAKVLRAIIMGFVIFTYIEQYSSYIKYLGDMNGRKPLNFLLAVLIVGILELLKAEYVWKYIERLEQGRYGCFIIAVIMVALLYVFVFSTSVTAYLTVDDGDIQAMLSGVLTGKPTGIHRWTNVALTQFISFLYSLMPGVQWWYVYSQILMAMGIFLVHYSVLSIGKKRNCKVCWNIGILAVVDVCLFFYAIAHIAFTVVPGVWGTGLVAYIFYLDTLEEKKKKRIWLIPFGFLLVTIHRYATSKALACYIMMAFLYFLIRSRMPKKQKLVYMVAISCALMLSMRGMAYIDSAVKNNVYGKEARLFEGWRGKYTDYSHASYDENPEVYEQAGWTKETYELVQQWNFWAEEVNTSSLKYIMENDGVESLLTEDINKLAFYKRDFRAVCIVGAFLLLILMWEVFRTEGILEKIFTIFNIIGTAILICYQIYGGRILYRSTVIVLLPAIIVNIILAQNACRKQGAIWGKKTLFQQICIVCVALVFILPTLEANYDSDVKQFVEEYEAKERALNEYVLLNKNEVYICRARFIRRISPYTIYPEDKPSNLISWEAMPDENGSSNAWLKQNGLSELSLQLFEHENVHFLYSKNLSKGDQLEEEDLFKTLLTYLKRKYDVVGFVREDHIEGVGNVYHFIGKEESSQYKQYLDISGNHVVEIY